MAKKKSEIYELGSVRRPYTYFPSTLITVNSAVDPKSRGFRSRGILQLLAKSGCGKTSMAYSIIAEAQRKNILKEVPLEIDGETTYINTVFVDVETEYDPEYAETCGVDTSKVLVIRARAFEIVATAVEDLLSRGVQLFVYDSLPATISQNEIDKDMDDPQKMAETANAVSRWLIRLIGAIDAADALFIVINQYRKNFQTMSRKELKPYGPESLWYFSVNVLEGAKIETEDGASKIKWTVSKSKQGPEGNIAEVYLRKGKGFDDVRDILNLALQFGIIRASGAWYYYGEQKAQGIGQCKDKFDMKKLREEVEKALYE